MRWNQEDIEWGYFTVDRAYNRKNMPPVGDSDNAKTWYDIFQQIIIWSKQGVMSLPELAG
jgi:hypothetical protein